MSANENQWYSVRCLFRWDSAEGAPYEERITVWLAGSIEAAIEYAEQEARKYAADNGVTYLQFAQAYAVGEGGRIQPGAEMFSLLRDSSLPPMKYLDSFFATGQEHLSKIVDQA
jgi:hypothetical protein